MSRLQPVQILENEATEEKGENARLASFVAAIAIADLVKTTLGPKGMDKILQSVGREGTTTVTNDGATILKSIYLDNPAAKLLVEISKAQDDEVGDGTTSVTVLSGELLREAEKLVAQKLHPQTIIDGYRLASTTAREALTKSAKNNVGDKEKFLNDLLSIARTTLSSKILAQEKDYFAKLCVDSVLRLKGSPDIEHIQIIKKTGGSLKDSYLEEGFILEKKIGVGQPKRLENAKIMIANTPMDTDKIKIFGARIRVDSTKKFAELEQAEKEKMIEKCQKIVGHGINCFVNRQLIYNLPEQYFTENKVMSIEHADFDGIERLARVTGGEIVSTFEHPEMVRLGTAKLIEEIMIGEDTAIRFSGVGAGEACTIVLRGATSQMLDEAERSIHDALCVLVSTVKETRTVLGAGCSEMLMAKAVDELATRTAGKKALAVEAFARALRTIPTIIADNGGYDSSDLVAKLRAEHYNGNTTAGLDMRIGVVGDIEKLGIVESYKVKYQVVSSASEAAEMILRVDDIIRTAPRKREDAGMH
jgi:T-complex protein 1 subunit beta